MAGHGRKSLTNEIHKFDAQETAVIDPGESLMQMKDIPEDHKHAYMRFMREKLPWLVRIVGSPSFETLIGIIIMFNCITIGVQVQMCPPEDSPRYREGECPKMFLDVSEHLATAIFLLEWIFHGLIWGFEAHVESGPALFDTGLVWITGVLFTWILGPLISTPGALRSLTALRAFRLLRLIRLVKNQKAFKETWMLLKGLADSSYTLWSTILVIVFVNYLFGIIAVTFIGDSPDFDDPSGVQSFFFGLDMTMFTLLQIITGDSWASGIARPVMKVIPFMWVYFTVYIGVGLMVLLNLITAVIVENALVESKECEEQQLLELKKKQEKEFAKLEGIFSAIDADGSGELDSDEFDEAIKDDAVMDKFKLLDFEEKEIPNLFTDIAKGEEQLSLEDFIHELRGMQGEAKARTVVRTMNSVERLHKRIDSILHLLDPAGVMTSRKSMAPTKQPEHVPGLGVDDPKLKQLCFSIEAQLSAHSEKMAMQMSQHFAEMKEFVVEAMAGNSPEIRSGEGAPVAKRQLAKAKPKAKTGAQRRSNAGDTPSPMAPGSKPTGKLIKGNDEMSNDQNGPEGMVYDVDDPERVPETTYSTPSLTPLDADAMADNGPDNILTSPIPNADEDSKVQGQSGEKKPATSSKTKAKAVPKKKA